MYRVAVCEDDAPTRGELIKRCGRVLTGFDITHDITPFGSAEELEAAVGSQAELFDLLLLDIRLPGKNGVTLGTALRTLNHRMGIIFITGYAEYALEGYKAQPTDYLLKPVTDAAFADALRRELKRHGKYQTVVFQERGRSVRLPASDILYMESLDHNTVVHTLRGAHTFSISLAKARELLPSGLFARCHNSYLVNLAYIKAVSGKAVELNNGARIPVGRAYRDDFHRIFISHFF